MSQESVETVTEVVEAFNTRGLDAALAYVHPELAWYAPPEWLERQVYSGRDGLRQLAESWGRTSTSTVWTSSEWSISAAIGPLLFWFSAGGSRQAAVRWN